jgi:hypothetical protein
LTGNPKTIVVNDTETSVTLAMRLVQAEEAYEAARQDWIRAYARWEQTRSDADRLAARDVKARGWDAAQQIGKLTMAGAARLRAEAATPPARRAKRARQWRTWMAWTIQDTRWRDSRFPELSA